MDRKRTSRILENHNLDGLIATTQENVAWASGFRTAESRSNYTTQIYAMLPGDSSQPICLVIPTISLSYVAQLMLPPEQVFTYGEFYFYKDEDADLVDATRRLSDLLAAKKPYPDGPSALRAALESAGLGSARVGLDEMGIDPSVYSKLESEAGCDIVPAYQLLRLLQAVKTPDEIAKLREASRIAEAAVEEVIEHMEPGITHRELVGIYRASAGQSGAIPTHVNFRFGPNSGLPSLLPSDTILARGDLIAWDVGLIYELYQADTARCAVLGKPTERQATVCEALRAGEQAAIGAIRPGVRAAEVFRIAVETVRKNGIADYNRNHCGHGIGVEAYGEPLIAPDDDTILEAGMAFCIETPYYQLGFGSPVVEDTVVILESGTEYLTHMQRELLVL